MTVKVSRILLSFLPRLDFKQRLFVSNMLGIASGAVIYTLWQIMIPLTSDVPEYSFMTKLGMIITSGALVWFALKLQRDKL